MNVEGKKSAPTRKMAGGQTTPKPPAQPARVSAPLRGLIFTDSIADPQPGGAKVMDNWICGVNTIRPRGGFSKFATIATDAVQSLFTYKVGAVETFFAASDDSIFDITTPASPTVIPSAAVSGQTNGFYSTEQFGTAGGNFLYACNGVDSPQLFDGSSWTAITDASSPSIAGVTTSGLSHVWSFANRLFFVEKNTMVAWYLPVDSIAGTASAFSLAGVFKKGGALLFGATWSLDSGDGPNEQCVFVSTEGEVAVYRGTNPGSASDWSKVGVYEISEPLGPKAVMKSGGDLMVATKIGLVPLTEAVRRDVADLSLGASSRGIETLWQASANSLTAVDWQIARWPSENIMIVTQPEATASNKTALIANLQTGAWSRFTGMDMQSVNLFAGHAFFGASDGSVYKLQSTGADDGTPYTCAYLGQFEGLGLPGAQKTVLQARPTFVSNQPIAPQITMRADYDETLSPAPNAASFAATEGWDVSKWDVSIWDATGTATVGADDSRWRSIGVTGYAHAVELQLTFGSTALPRVEYVGADITMRPGGLVA